MFEDICTVKIGIQIAHAIYSMRHTADMLLIASINARDGTNNHLTLDCHHKYFILKILRNGYILFAIHRCVTLGSMAAEKM